MLHMLIANGTIKSIDDDVSKYEPRFGYINSFNTKKITFRYVDVFNDILHDHFLFNYR